MENKAGKEHKELQEGLVDCYTELVTTRTRRYAGREHSGQGGRKWKGPQKGSVHAWDTEENSQEATEAGHG